MLEFYLRTRGRWDQPHFESLIGDHMERTRGARLLYVAPDEVLCAWAFAEVDWRVSQGLLSVIEVQA